MLCAATNLLHDLDKAAQDIIDRISDASAAAAGGAPGIIKFDEDLPQLNICRPVCDFDFFLTRQGF